MPNLTVNIDVLIVGAGPVGLLVANECARRGLRWRLVESRAGQSEHSKALAMTRVMGTPNRLAQVLRDAVIPMVSRLSPFQHAFVQRLSELGVDYSGSPILEGPGTRYLEDSMRGGAGILSRFLLFLGPDTDAETVAAAAQLARKFADVVESRRSGQPGLSLVRPDGYLASAGSGRTGLSEIDAVLERQTGPRSRAPVAAGR